MKRFRPHLRHLRDVKWHFIGALFCAAVYGISSGFGVPYMMNFIFPKVFAENAAELSRMQILGYALWLPAIFLVRGLSGYLNHYLINFCGFRVLEGVRSDYFAKLQRLPLAFFHKHATGDLISRGLADTNQLQMTLTNSANEAFKQPIIFMGAIAALIYLSFQNQNVVFMLLCVISIPLAVLPIRIVGQNLLRRARQVQSSMGSVTERLSENLGALKEVRAFGLEKREEDRFRDTIRSLFHVQLKVVKYAAALSPTIEFLAAFGVSAAFVYAYHVRLPWEVFFAMCGALYFSYDPIKKVGFVSNELKKGAAALDRLEVILNEPESIADAPDATDAGRLRGDIEFRGVTFAYDEEPVLHNASIAIPAGTVCALVGPSGAGKSTFANLVPRFYDATGGAVLIDGRDVRSLTVQSLRRNIALVSQDPVLFNDTIRNNIRLGRPDATDAEVEQASINAFVHDFARAQPQGYETIVGERGTLLSGGQKQRLALARAFLRNAPILILDEATSALDTESERMVQEALRKLMHGRTVLIIAHRFSTIRDAGMILVFDHGRIIGSGSHEEVYATSPLYHRLYDQQQIG
ncbi:MAG TPA: ABC transporter ATP-binding protein [Opitutaceae bacterium]|nr:ABC transporter ATP-binding protein [Opitutaceae bacterium]